MHMRRVHLNMRTEGIKAFSKQIRRCGMDGRKRYENGKCGRKYSWKRSKTAPFSFENGLVWTGPSIVNVSFTTSLCRLITIVNSVFARITEWFRITPRQPYCCPKTMERRPCWFPKPTINLKAPGDVIQSTLLESFSHWFMHPSIHPFIRSFPTWQ